MTALRFMSYNIRYARLDTEERAWPARRDAVASAIRFHRPDVVGVQECWLDQLPDLRDRLDEFRWVAGDHRHGPHTPIGYRPDRFRPIRAGSFWLSESGEPGVPDWGASVPRVATYARLRDIHGGSEFLCCNVHLDHRTDRARVEGARLVAERLGDLASDCPAVVVGDLNDTPGSEPCAILSEAGVVDARTLAATSYGPAGTYTDWGRDLTGRPIDYVLLPEPASVDVFGSCLPTDAAGNHPSDHLPVLASCTLPD